MRGAPELGFAFDRHLILDESRHRRRREAELAERCAAIPEDPWIAVVVGAERIA